MVININETHFTIDAILPTEIRGNCVFLELRDDSSAAQKSSSLNVGIVPLTSGEQISMKGDAPAEYTVTLLVGKSSATCTYDRSAMVVYLGKMPANGKLLCVLEYVLHVSRRC